MGPRVLARYTYGREWTFPRLCSAAGKLRAESVTYQLMNILGAAGFVVNSGWNGALPSAVMNVVWIGIGLYALYQLRRRSALT